MKTTSTTSTTSYAQSNSSSKQQQNVSNGGMIAHKRNSIITYNSNYWLENVAQKMFYKNRCR